MSFYRHFITPSLGPYPTSEKASTQWRSFMTDDFTPIEFSWRWGNAKRITDRRVRFSIEAIGYQAGLAADLWCTAATYSLIDQLTHLLPSVDLQWFHRLASEIIPRAEATASDSPPLSESSPSSIFLGFELGDQEPVLKAYMLPTARAMIVNRSCAEILHNTLRRLAQDTCWTSLAELLNMLEKGNKTFKLTPFMISFDCIAPSESRMKIYVRSPDTSLASVERVLSMFDDRSSMSNGLAELRHLWRLVFQLEDGHDPESPLTDVCHETAGILYYLEVRPGSLGKIVKVYLPVKHYSQNDLSVVSGLTQFMKARHRDQDQAAEKYLQVLEEICNHRKLDSGLGLQTYISCVIEDDSLDVTSYLSPEVYRRWAGSWP